MEKVFLQPDRSFEERLQHRKLIGELKKKAEEVPENHFFIRKGQICSEPKHKVEAPVTQRPPGPRSGAEGVIMRLKAAGKPIPPELYNIKGRRKQISYSEDYTDSDC